MHVLALETSHLPGSIHLADATEGRFSSRGDVTLPGRLSTAQCFAPVIRELLHAAQMRPTEVRLVAVDIGPGSFTGLRIAVTFAKAFAYATGADVLGISSMDILAYQGAAAASVTDCRLWTVIDAHRGQVFAARFERDREHPWRQSSEARILEIERWTSQLTPQDVVTGPVVERLAWRLPAGVRAVPDAARLPTAETVARLAWERWQSGERGDLWRLNPNYIRRSAAEEKRDAAPP